MSVFAWFRAVARSVRTEPAITGAFGLRSRLRQELAFMRKYGDTLMSV
jgi:hypothetical protein